MSEKGYSICLAVFLGILMAWSKRLKG